MLVLSRKANQRIVIAENIEVVIVAVSGGRVKLGFVAPSNVPIHREEVHRRMHAEDDSGNDPGAPRGNSLATAAALAEAEIVLAGLKQGSAV